MTGGDLLLQAGMFAGLSGRPSLCAHRPDPDNGRSGLQC